MNEAIASAPPEQDRQPGKLSWANLRPLTRARKDSGEAYTREPIVSAQIKQFCQLPDKERRKALIATFMMARDPLRPKEETLVYFVREYDQRGDFSATAWELLETIITRIPGSYWARTGKVASSRI